MRAIRIEANNSNPVILREFDKFFEDVATIVIADKQSLRSWILRPSKAFEVLDIIKRYLIIEVSGLVNSDSYVAIKVLKPALLQHLAGSNKHSLNMITNCTNSLNSSYMLPVSVARTPGTSFSIKGNDPLAATNTNPKASLIKIPDIARLNVVLITDSLISIKPLPNIIRIMSLFASKLNRLRFDYRYSIPR